MAGRITKRSRSSYTVIVDFPRDALTGKRRQITRSIKGSRKDAERLLAELNHQKHVGLDVPNGQLSVTEYLHHWLESYAKPNLANSTYTRYEGLIRVHILPMIGAIKLEKLRSMHVESVHRNMRENGLAPRSIGQAHRVLKEALTHAVRQDLLARNPVAGIRAPRVQRAKIQVLSKAESQMLVDACGGVAYEAMIQLALDTGMRMGELRGLSWRGVDLEGRVVQIRQTVERSENGEYKIKPPKTHRSRRPIALMISTVEMLRRHRLHEMETRLKLGSPLSEDQFVFQTVHGEPLDPANIRRAFAAVLKRAGLPRIRFHDLRHTHATLLFEQGVHPKVVSERLGHATIGITLDIYSHVIPGMQEDAVAKLERVLGNRRVSGE